MVRRRRRKAKRSTEARRAHRYSAVELIIAGVGALMLAIVVGMIISSVLSG